jgi:hypothetical protein
MISSPSSPCFILKVPAKRSDDSIIAGGWLRDKPYLLTTDMDVCDHLQA